LTVSFLRRKSAQPLTAVEKRKQNSKNKRQNSEDGKEKNQNHKILLSAKGRKILINRLFDLDLLGLKPCSAERLVLRSEALLRRVEYAVLEGLANIIPDFGQKVKKN
jgi:hypothetical protein